MNLHKLALILLILAIAFSCNNVDKQKDVDNKYHEFDNFFLGIEDFSGNVLVSINGKRTYFNSFGYANRAQLIKNTIDTKFRIGSISKPITALAVMILTERGLIDVHDSLSTYISNIPAAWEEITIHQLLTHTSGLAYEPDEMETKYNLTIEKILEKFKSHPLMNEPGAAMNYSNMGYFVLSIVVEKVSNQPFDSFIKDEVFEKLGMGDSGSDYPDQNLRLEAEGYEVDSDGNVQNAAVDNLLIKRGAGNMYSTVEDLLKLEKAFSSGALLSDETLNKMLTPYTSDIEMGADVKYGYGLDLIQNDSINAIFHTGGVLGYESMFCMFPERDIVITACANTTKLNRDWRTDFQQMVYNFDFHQE